MKFEHQLTFNAHAPWKDAYLNYSKLKALAYDAERHASAAAAARAEGDEREAAARMGRPRRPTPRFGARSTRSGTSASTFLGTRWDEGEWVGLGVAWAAAGRRGPADRRPTTLPLLSPLRKRNSSPRSTC